MPAGSRGAATRPPGLDVLKVWPGVSTLVDDTMARWKARASWVGGASAALGAIPREITHILIAAASSTR